MLLHAGLAVHLRLAHGRAGGHVVVGLKTVDVLPGQVPLDYMLYIVELLDLVGADQRIGLAGRPGPAGATNAVHVVLGHIGQVEIHHLRQLGDIQAPGRDVRGHQHPYLAVLEVGQGLGARRLALVAVDGRGIDAGLLQLLGELVGAVLGAAEYQYLLPVILFHQLLQHRGLVFLVHRVDPLFHALGGGVGGRNFHLHRVVQDAPGKLPDLVGEGCRKQQVLAPGRQQLQDTAYIVDKAHIQHTIGFVQHQDFYFVKTHFALLVKIEQAAGCGDQNIHALAQRGDLRVDFYPTEHHRRFERQVLAVGDHALLYLGSQFASGSNDQCARAMRVRGRMGAQQLQDRQDETRRLTGAGLGCRHNIAAGQHRGNCLHLDRGWLGVTFFLNCTQQGRGQAELVKCHGVSLGLMNDASAPNGNGRMAGGASYSIPAPMGTAGCGRPATAHTPAQARAVTGAYPATGRPAPWFRRWAPRRPSCRAPWPTTGTTGSRGPASCR